MSTLTITAGGKTTREEFDYNDPKAVAAMRAKFDAAVSQGNALGYATTASAGTETLHRGEFPSEQAQITVQPQYAGG